jgi:uncharacterized membrane protein
VRSSLRASWLSVKASYWFIPSLMTIAAFALALFTIHLDRLWGSEWLLASGWVESSRPEGARAQLTVIAGAMIAISSTVFAITISAVAFASGNYGPRLLTNFMNDRGNQVSLGVFIATFVYNLPCFGWCAIRRMCPAPGESAAEAVAFVPQLSMLVSSATVLLAVAVLVFFLHHVPASIRVNTVLGGRAAPDKRHREAVSSARNRRRAEARSAGVPVSAASIGYVEIIDSRRSTALHGTRGGRCRLRIRTGDFITRICRSSILAAVRQDEALKERVRDCFSLGDSRTPTQDLEFLIDELVEIGMRALSPGVNDPFTAVTAIHWMGASLAKLADRDLSAGPEQEDYDVERVRPLPDDFRHYLRRSFGAFRASAASSPIGAQMTIEALAGVAVAASPERRAALSEEARLLMAQAELELEGPALQEVRVAMAAFEDQMGGSQE